MWLVLANPIHPSDCASGLYGKNCASQCGKCAGTPQGTISINSNCDPISGACPGGCEDWYIPDRCDFYLGTGSSHHTFTLLSCLLFTLDIVITID